MYEKAFREVNEILGYMDSEYTSKISPDFMNMLINNADWNYEFKYDESKSLENQNLLDETKTILSILYYKYFASHEEKVKIIEVLTKNENKDILEKSQKYSTEKLFDEKNIANSINISDASDNEAVSKESNELILVKEKWYRKILNKIKNFLRF